MEKRKSLAVICLCAAFLIIFSVWGLLKPDEQLSKTERRALAQWPELTLSSVLDGSFMEQFEQYTLDQFPLRERFRQLKAVVAMKLLGQKDNNGIYLANAHAARLDMQLDTASLSHAAERFALIYDRYLAGTDTAIYASVIPDKNAFLAQQSGYPTLDYAELAAQMYERMPYARSIDLTPALSLDCYYRTDLHWRQECLLPAARLLASGMGVELTQSYETITTQQPFYGVYYGQLALPMEADTLQYLTNDTLRACTVYDYETDAELAVYDTAQLGGQDAYSLFLSGSKSLLRLTNPNAQTERELIVFRDSFASSLIPLLAEGYSSITLVDIRYVQPERLGTWLQFDKQDVLFLYSAAVLNSSETIK